MSNNQKLIECLFNSINEYNQFKYTAFLKQDANKNAILSQSASMLMIMWLMSANFDAEKGGGIYYSGKVFKSAGEISI